MDEKFLDYLLAINIKVPFRKRVEEVLEFYENACPDKIDAVFISDYVREDGTRELTSLWLFSKNYIMEAHAFLDRDHFDMMRIIQIAYWEVEKENYDFKRATEKSRLKVHFRAIDRWEGDLRASGRNCDFLRDILKLHLVPRYE